MPRRLRGHPEILADVANIQRGTEMQVVNHYNIHRVLDVYGNVQDRDLGAVSAQIDKIVARHKKDLPKGSLIRVRGQIETMRASYFGLISGLGFAIVLVYLLIVVNFQSWLDPFIIITALPAALAGIMVFLFLTHTTLSVPALMGAIMCMGVATANSILVVSFATERLAAHGHAINAALEAGATRFRPVMMTALGDDHRHGTHGAGRWRRRRAERAAGPSRHRRTLGGDAGHAGLRPLRLRPCCTAAAVRRRPLRWSRKLCTSSTHDHATCRELFRSPQP